MLNKSNQVTNDLIYLEMGQYECSKMVWFGLVWFYRTSNIVGYLTPNPLYTEIFDIYDLYVQFVDNVFKRT